MVCALGFALQNLHQGQSRLRTAGRCPHVPSYRTILNRSSGDPQIEIADFCDPTSTRTSLYFFRIFFRTFWGLNFGQGICTWRRDAAPVRRGAGSRAGRRRYEVIASAGLSLVKHNPFEDGAPAVTVHRLIAAAPRGAPYPRSVAATFDLAINSFVFERLSVVFATGSLFLCGDFPVEPRKVNLQRQGSSWTDYSGQVVF